jgi:beta-glucosidase
MRKDSVVFRFAVAAVVASVFAPRLTAQNSPGLNADYLNPAVPTERRVEDLIKRMTLEEKVAQLQDVAAAIPRLNIRAYTWGNEGLHGDAFTGYMTLFPQVIGMASTWDTALVRQMANVVGVEARARYNLDSVAEDGARFTGVTFWAPNINIFRDPRWGRGQETYGEDPFLTARMGVSYVAGLQGDDPHYLLALAGPKHFAVHSGPEPDRHRWDSSVSAHDLADTYLPAFHAAISEGHAGSVMCSYNRINGTPACANPWLLNTTLRGQWGFQGFVISDCGAIGDISAGHHYAKDDEHSSAAAINAGMDSSCGWVPDGQRPEYSYLLEAARDGLVKPEVIDRALRRVLTMRIRLGLLDPPEAVPFGRFGSSAIRSEEHRALALRAARESMVLLKNDDHFLPLHGAPSIAVVGPDADLTQAIEGNYNAVPLDPVTPLAGLQRRLGAAKVRYSQGATLAPELPIVMPYDVLRPDAAQSGYGLRGEYFANTGFNGTPALVRTDRHINFDWDKAEPAPGLPREDYSVRWTGTFTPPAPGVYQLGAKVRGCTDCHQRETLRLYLDGKLLLEEGAKHTVPVRFMDTRPHPLRLEYVHRNVPTHHMVTAGIDLLWAAPAAVQRELAVNEAKAADVTVAFVGLSPELEGEELPVKLPGFDGGDRTDLALPSNQLALLDSLAATGRPLVVVLMNGSAVTASVADRKAKAVLEAWYPGEAGGAAVAETLFGENNPAGRLPVTFYNSADQLPPFGSYSMAGRTYRYFRGKPWHGFGFGLSYASFSYSGLTLSTNKLTPGAPLKATVKVKNTSSIAGDEVVELYLEPPNVPTNPRVKLVGFTRLHMAAGEEQTVSIDVAATNFESIAEDGTPRLLPGSYRLIAAGAQPDEAQSVSAATLEVPR